jgi:hypothetical protein
MHYDMPGTAVECCLLLRWVRGVVGWVCGVGMLRAGGVRQGAILRAGSGVRTAARLCPPPMLVFFPKGPVCRRARSGMRAVHGRLVDG